MILRASFTRPLLWLSSLATACGSSGADAPHGSGGGPVPPGGGFVSRSVKDTSGLSIPIQVFIPGNYDRSRRWPVIVALAGQGERGNDGLKQTNVGMGLVVRAEQASFPAVVVFPQVPADEAGRQAFDRVIIQAISGVVRDYNGDPDRVYLTGLSFGATEGFVLAYANPTTFAAYATIAPGIPAIVVTGDRSTPNSTVLSIAADRLRSLPLWVFQGENDPNVPVAYVRSLVAAFRAVDPTVQYTEYAGAGHNVWDAAYATPALYTWLFAQHR
ncbi:hypothetical protein tb265_44290 [Gemmatimonadetes bacterium T265]|nr:hypothetical protein tb265_44290 [Gemmatimonadetes bacterium T265]